MSENNPLDAPVTPVVRSTFDKLHRIFFGIELALWGLTLGALVLLGLSTALIFCLLLFIVYLFFPILIFGSRDWKRHLLSHLTGLALAAGFVPALFALVSWGGAYDWALCYAIGGGLLAVIFFIMMAKSNNAAPPDRFYVHLPVPIALQPAIEEVLYLLWL